MRPGNAKRKNNAIVCSATIVCIITSLDESTNDLTKNNVFFFYFHRKITTKLIKSIAHSYRLDIIDVEIYNFLRRVLKWKFAIVRAGIGRAKLITFL